MTDSEGYFLEDPWDWTIDRVVAALCDDHAGYRAVCKPEDCLPEAASLEQMIREHCISGRSLLTAIDYETLREEFGIRALGPRAIIVQEIRRLKIGSRQWVAAQDEQEVYSSRRRTRLQTPAARRQTNTNVAHTTETQPTPEATNDIGSTRDTSPVTPHHQILSHEQDSIQQSQQWLNGIPDSPQVPIIEDAAVGATSDDLVLGIQNETYIVDETGRKRRKLCIDMSAPVNVPEESIVAAGNGVTAPTEGQHVTPTLKSPPSPVDAAPQEGRRRIAPTLISQPPQFDNVSVESAVHASERPEIPAGRPIKQEASRNTGFLGTKALPVDDLFYTPENELQKQVDDPCVNSNYKDSDNFAFFGISDGNGEQRYVAARMKYFLQQRPNLYRRGGKLYFGICLYPDYFGQAQKPSSITIFEPNASTGEVQPVRRDRALWMPQNLSSHRRVSDAIKLNTAPSRHQDDGENWDFLDKWTNLHDDHPLPAFGDSGSEGEYDLDTWREIQKDIGVKLERPLGRSKGFKKLTAEEVQEAIDNAVNSICKDWKEKRLPKLRRTAWMLWSKSRRNRTKKIQISSLEFDIQHLKSRLGKIQSEVAREQWISAAKVVKQCESMRRTVYDLQESEWTVETLRLKIRPEKLGSLLHVKPQNSRDRESAKVKDVEAASSIAETSTDEDLDDFIVDDDFKSEVRGGDQLIYDEASTTDEVDPNDDEEQVIYDEASRTDDVASHCDVEQSTNNEITSRMLSPQIVEASANYIDLTLGSDGSEAETVSKPTAFNPNSIRTWPNNKADSLEESSQRIERKKAQFKSPPGIEKFRSLSATPQTPSQFPPLNDTDSIRKLNPAVLMERADRKRLLIYVLARTSQYRRRMAYEWLSDHDRFSAKEGVWRTLESLRNYRRKVKGSGSHLESETLKQITAWYISWTNVIRINKEKGATEEQMKAAADDEEGFEPFYAFLVDLRCLADYKKACKTSDSDSCVEVVSHPTPNKRRGSVIDYSETEGQNSARKRKYAVTESQEAANIRKKAHQRVEDRERRQDQMKKALKKMGQTEENPSQVVVNLGKLDGQDLIYLPDSIGRKIQKHQKEGLRFLWREIIEDHASKQGALLAQTMGLGKTMQVISFLLTVAIAAKSTNENIRDQIPPRLRESKTIIVCPPALVENWEEEFFQWAPDDLKDTIGDIRTVSSAMDAPSRLRTISEWGDDGGVLVIGSWILRDLISSNPKQGTSHARTDEEQRSVVKDIILTGPNIVVVDEAHTAKNPTSQLNKALGQFRSRSRIALTGSPLSNNLREFYALIEWVAPGYLGEHREFTYRYEEPIQLGLWGDSSAQQWRLGLKRLELFKREVGPKVHRADFSVLASRLKGKSEFVIKVDTTDLQRRLYQTFVVATNEHLPGVADKVFQSKLWAWVAKLRLVCNHPSCFYENLMETKSGSKKMEGDAKDEDEANENTDLGLSEGVVRQQLEVFNDLTVPLDSITLAYKMTLLLQIVELCKLVGDKVLVFSQSLITLDYIGRALEIKRQNFTRMDGKVPTQKRQAMTREFNHEDKTDIFLISTKAGGTGLNLFGANRVIVVDSGFNPTWEEQAVGRAYRIGQSKHVFVYRLTVGGTFEDILHNQTLFKQQLATRAVDKRSIARSATRNALDYFRPLQIVEQTDLEQFRGKDPFVLDRILDAQVSDPYIRSIVPCETFQQEVKEELTAEEQKEVEEEEATSRLRRTDPIAYHAQKAQQEASRAAQQAELFAQSSANVNGGNLAPSGMAAVAHLANPSSNPYDADMPPPNGRSFTVPPPANQNLPPSRSGDARPHSTGPAGLNGHSGMNAPWAIDPNVVGQWMKGQGEEGNAGAMNRNNLPILGANTMMALDTVASSTPQTADASTASGPEKASRSRQASEDVAKGTFAPFPSLSRLLTQEAERSQRD
ncbi:MAG: hypothetical protein LQ350_004816 [Teloschistes chrysophthalmus]|nr:MAG: hypothetical protein LQ350_004816 [Niorma chrysophthalma]